MLREATLSDVVARQELGRHADIERMFGAAHPVSSPMTQAVAEAWIADLGGDGRVEWVVEAEGGDGIAGRGGEDVVGPDVAVGAFAEIVEFDETLEDGEDEVVKFFCGELDFVIDDALDVVAALGHGEGDVGGVVGELEELDPGAGAGLSEFELEAGGLEEFFALEGDAVSVLCGGLGDGEGFDDDLCGGAVGEFLLSGEDGGPGMGADAGNSGDGGAVFEPGVWRCPGRCHEAPGAELLT